MKKLVFLFLALTMLTIADVNVNRSSAYASVKPAATFAATLSRGSNVSGTWAIEFNGPAGVYTFAFNSGTVTVPTGTYQVGIYPVGGGSSVRSYLINACTLSYSSSGTSALFSNVQCTCSGGTFSLN